MLDEVIEEYKKLDEWSKDRVLRKKTAAEKLKLVQEYNKKENPGIEANLVVALVNVGFTEGRVYDADEAKEIVMAYQKCAQNLSKAEKEEKNKDKLRELNEAFYNLVRATKSFVRAHKETSAQILNIYDKYMVDRSNPILEDNLADRGTSIIDAIGSCMRRNPKIWDKGFQAIHRVINNEVQKAKLRHDKNPKLICQEPLRILFSDLYMVSSSAESIEQIVKHYDSFSNNMDNDHTPNFEIPVKGARIYIDREEFDSYEGLIKYILKKSMKQLKKNQGKTEKGVEDCNASLGVIYNRLVEEYEDKISHLRSKKTAPKPEKKKTQGTGNNNSIDTPAEFNVDLIYAGDKRPTVNDIDRIIPRSPVSDRETVPSKPRSGGLWTSPMEENGKSAWQNFIEQGEWFSKDDLLEKYKQSWHIVPTEDCRILVFDDFRKIEKYLKSDKTIDFIELSKDYDLLYVPFEFGPQNKTFEKWDIKTGFFMNSRTRDGKPIFLVFDDEEYKRYKIEKNKQKVAALKGKDPLQEKIPGNTGYNKALMKALREAKGK